MWEQYIEDLIGRMIQKDAGPTNSDDSVSWHAYREAEQLTQPELYPILKNYIESHPKPKDKTKRHCAYFILGKLLRHVPQREYLAFFLACLEQETDKYILSAMLDRIADLQLPDDVSVDYIASLAMHKAWLVRHSAINALGASFSPEGKKILLYYINQEDTKACRFEIVYAIAALGRIGTKDDIPLLERHVHSRLKDVRESAEFAIERIEKRSQSKQ